MTTNRLPPLFLAICLAWAASSCAARPPHALSPQENSAGTLVSETPDGEDQNEEPVYVLPVYSSGWIKATVNQETGEYMGPQYVKKVVRPGYWTTQLEAERSGNSFVNYSAQGRATLTGSSGDWKGMVRAPDEAKGTEPEDPGLVPSASDRPEAATDRDGSSEIPSSPNPPFQTADGEKFLDIPTTPPAYATSTHRAISENQVEIPGNARDDYDIPLPGGHDKVHVHFLDALTAEITFRGKVRRVHLKAPDEPIKITLE